MGVRQEVGTLQAPNSLGILGWDLEDAAPRKQVGASIPFHYRARAGEATFYSAASFF